MSSARKSAQKIAATADGDHRKRRRNRTTQSCLNCHTTKRMCDRKRPCSRCTQLGIGANCVYEVDDPNRQNKEDEGARLMKRIAELEEVIRELKNKPPPRPSPSPDNLSGPPPHTTAAWPSLPSTSRGSQSTGYINSDDSVASLVAAYAGLADHMFIRRGGNCGCVNDAACYNVVLELSLRLRRAADVLSRSPSHSSNLDCNLNSQISDLDIFAKDNLFDVPSQSPAGPAVNYGHGPGRVASPNMFSQSYFPSVWNTPDASDGFMTWTPGQRK